MTAPSQFTTITITKHNAYLPRRFTQFLFWLNSTSSILVFCYNRQRIQLGFHFFNTCVQMLRLHLIRTPLSSFFLPINSFSNGNFPTTTKLRSSMATYSSSSQCCKLLFRQLFEKESSTYTYLLADASHPTKPALVTSILLILCFSQLKCWLFCKILRKLNSYKFR